MLTDADIEALTYIKRSKLQQLTHLLLPADFQPCVSRKISPFEALLITLTRLRYPVDTITISKLFGYKESAIRVMEAKL
jgi:hypothetical protein